MWPRRVTRSGTERRSTTGMPVILPSEAWSTWLREEPASADELQALLKPFPAERMRAYLIGARE
jgi:putative SOS response-associated peptidase YedK